MNRRTAIKATAAASAGALVISKEFLKAEESAQPFGPDFPRKVRPERLGGLLCF